MKINIMPNIGVISCEVFKPELTALGIDESRIVYLEQKFHRDPQILREKVMAALACLEQDIHIDTVILFYGYCGGGLKGLSSKRLRFIIPLAHDCIPLILGACPVPDYDHAFFLSPGWIDHGLTPYTEYFEALEKYGQEDALWLGMEILKGYKEVVLIETVADILPHHRRYAKKMADHFCLSFREVKADGSWLVNLLSGLSSEHVRIINPGNSVSLDFYSSAENPACRP